MNKTFTLRHYEFILDSREFISPPLRGFTPLIERLREQSTVPFIVSPLHDRVEEANRKREEKIPFDESAPSGPAWTDEEILAREYQEQVRAEKERRYLNRKENANITGWHFFGCVFYHTPNYPGLRSWVFRNSSKEYSFSVIDTRKRTERQNSIAADMKIMSKEEALKSWMNSGPANRKHT